MTQKQHYFEPKRHPMEYAPLVNFLHGQRLMEIAEKWDEEASEAALAGNGKRAHYIESLWAGPMAERAVQAQLGMA